VPDGGGWLAIAGAGQRIGLTEQHAARVYPVVAQIGMADGSNQSLTGEVTVTATRFPVEAIYLAPAETALLDPALTQRELAILRPLYDGFTPRRLWEGFFVRPTSGEITDVFGSRRSYNGGPAVGSHSGVDFGADAGTPVLAAATGRVAYAGPLPVRGNTVVIDHGAGVFTGYCHLSSISAQVEQDMRAGDEIARVGSSGLATGPHLHWEVAVGGYHVNGMLWLAE
jgi:murein DD-endopeptidase MepM/ murein hydrolase activator NlpD